MIADTLIAPPGLRAPENGLAAPDTALIVCPEPEVLTPTPLEVLAIPSPLGMESARVRVSMPHGLSLLEILERLAIPKGCGVWIEIDGRNVSVEDWRQLARIRPKPGRTISVRAVPMDSGSGGGSGKTARLVLSIVVVIAAALVSYGVGAALGAGGLGLSAGLASGLGYAAGAVTAIGGSLLLNPC